jgi:hypothetical protein
MFSQKGKLPKSVNYQSKENTPTMLSSRKLLLSSAVLESKSHEPIQLN